MLKIKFITNVTTSTRADKVNNVISIPNKEYIEKNLQLSKPHEFKIIPKAPTEISQE